MARSEDRGSPPTMRSEQPRRNIAQWAILLLIWALGLAVWTIYIAAFLFLFFRFFT